MKTLYLLRNYHNSYTQGTLLEIAENGSIAFVCATVELPNRDNAPQVSCIPEGAYEVIPHKSASFGNCFSLPNVDGRSLIRIHAGNSTKNTRGCILVGDSSEPGYIVGSRKTLNRMVMRYPQGFVLKILTTGNRSATFFPPYIVEVIGKLLPTAISAIQTLLSCVGVAKRRTAQMTVFKEVLNSSELEPSDKVELLKALMNDDQLNL